MEALLAWFVALVTAYPTGIMILTLAGSALVIMSILAPVIVKLTYWTDKDDKLWAAVEKNALFKTIVKALGSFSVYVPKKKV